MARHWTCPKCRERWPRTKQRCDCGRKRPAARVPAHRAALDRPYEWWVERYGEVCGICGQPPKAGRRLHRDHDHAMLDGQGARGLLCFRCNSALRSYMTLEWVEAAAVYLRRAHTGRIVSDGPDEGVE